MLPAASSSRNIKRRELAVDLVVTVGYGPATTRFAC